MIIMGYTWWTKTPVTVLNAVLMVATLAVTFSLRSELPRWWALLQMLFPFAVLVALALAFPPWWYLLAFALSTLLFWSTFRTQVPYYPSTKKVWKTVETLLPTYNTRRIIDIGCGLGGLAVYLQKRNSLWQLTGIEIAPLPWLLCTLRTLRTTLKPTWLLGDYHKLDFANYDTVFAYLSPAAMTDLWQKVHTEMSKGSYLLSFEFPVPSVTPSQIIEVGHKNLYVYILPGALPDEIALVPKKLTIV